MMFDLARRHDGEPDLFNFVVEMKPLRKSPDPYDVEEFLEDKFDRDELKRLEDIAAGERG